MFEKGLWRGVMLSCAAMLGVAGLTYAAGGGGGEEGNAASRLRNDVPGVGLYATGSRVTKAFGKPMAFGSTPKDSAEMFRIRYADVFGARAADLVPAGIGGSGAHLLPVMFEGSTGRYKFTLVTYKQVRQGIEVFRSDLRLLVRNEPGNPLVLASSSLRDLSNYAPGQAVAQFDARQVGTGMTTFTKPQPVIWAGINDKSVPPVLAVQFVGSKGSNATADIERWLFVVDPTTNQIFHKENQIVHTDVSGNVSGLATSGNGADFCEPEVQVPLAHADVSIQGGNSALTDTNGDYLITNSGTSDVTVESPMSGLYFVISDAEQAEEVLTQTVTPPGPADFVHNTANDSEFVRAEVNGFFDANRVRDFALTQNPSYPTIATQTDMPVNVNIARGRFCPGNAWYDPTDVTINFCKAGSGFPNTAFSGVIHHEYGHHLINTGGSGQGEYGEGMGDCIAVLIADDPVLAPGFTGDCNSGLRNADNTMQYPCTSTSIHTCGQILSGCVWDTRNELAITNPSTYLDILSNITVNSILLHAGDEITPQIYNDFLTLDDDDANLSNGTPHKAEITAGFDKHNMVPAPGPENDDCANATVACNGETFTGSTANANSDGEASCADASNSPSVWFRYTPGVDGSATFSLCGSGTDYDAAMSIHTACPGDTTNEVGCDDDTCSAGGPAEITLNVTTGTEYLVRVSGWNGSSGNYSFTITGPDCGLCASDADCDDGDACNGAETCDVNGACQAGTPVDCDDANACTADSCDPATGTCSNDPISCDDGDACTTDSCDAATGCSNDPVNCDDGDPCTADSCDSATGTCVNDPAPTCCGDGVCETGEDSCSCSTDCGAPPTTETNCGDGIDEDCDGLTDCDDADCDGDPNCPTNPQAIVECITYDANVTIDVLIVDDSGNPVSGASVTVEAFVNGGSVGTATGTTDSSGVTGFRLRGTSNGDCITTTVLDVTASGLTWDGTEPADGYQKQVDSKPDADCRNCADACGDDSCGQ